MIYEADSRTSGISPTWSWASSAANSSSIFASSGYLTSIYSRSANAPSSSIYSGIAYIDLIIAASEAVFDFCDKSLETYDGALETDFLLAYKDLKFEMPSPLFLEEGA